MAGHLRNGTGRIPFLSSTQVRICSVTGKSGLLQMQNFPFIFKILYPDVAGRKLIYSGGAAKETSQHLASCGGLRKG